MEFKENKKRAILIPAFNRSMFLEKTLSALTECRGIDKYDCFIVIDGNSERGHDKQILKVAKNVESSLFNFFQIMYRKSHVGLTKNILWGLRDTIGRDYDYVVVIEEDIIISKDALEFMSYIHENYELEDMNVFSISGCNNEDNFYKDKQNLVRKRFWNQSILVSYPNYVWKYIEPHVTEEYYQKINNRIQEEEMKKYLFNNFYDIISKVQNSKNDINKLFTGNKCVYPLQAGLLNCIRASIDYCQLIPYCSRVKHIGSFGWNQRIKRYNQIPEVKRDDYVNNPHQYFSIPGDMTFKNDHTWEKIIIE